MPPTQTKAKTPVYRTQYVLHIRLDDCTQPSVWRELVVPASLKLNYLEWWIKGAFNWVEGTYHLGVFKILTMQPMSATSKKTATKNEAKEEAILREVYGEEGYTAHVPWK